MLDLVSHYCKVYALRAWQLLAEVNLDLCAPSRSLTSVMEALSVCNKHHLPLHSPSLLLGKVMVCIYMWPSLVCTIALPPSIVYHHCCYEFVWHEALYEAVSIHFITTTREKKSECSSIAITLLDYAFLSSLHSHQLVH